MKQFKYKTIFSSQIKPIVSEERDKYLAKASIEELKKFIPEMDLERNHDLLPVAFSAFNINQFNKNHDGVDSETAVNLYKTFLYKFVDLEHKRTNILGVILSSVLSEYVTDKQVTEKEVIGSTKPANCTLGAVIWRVANPDLANAIEDCNNVSSDFYNKLYASFEVGFCDYNIVSINGSSKNLEDGKIISDPEEIKVLEPFLVSNGGKGQAPDGSRLFRLIKGEALGLGVAITESPAGFLRPLVVQNDTKTIETPTTTTEISKNNINNNSHIILDNVNNTKNNNFMDKISSIKDITDDSLKTIKASVISDFIESQLTADSAKWAKEKKEKDEAMKVATDRSEAIAKDLEKANKELSTIKAEVETLNKARTEQEKVTKFNQRMTSLDDTYDLAKEDREIIAKRIQSLDDEGFTSYEKELAVFLKDKNKVAKAEALKVAEAAKKNQEATASAQKTIDDAVDNAEKDKNKVPNGTTTAPKNLKEKYAAAFSLENFTITK